MSIDFDGNPIPPRPSADHVTPLIPTEQQPFGWERGGEFMLSWIRDSLIAKGGDDKSMAESYSRPLYATPPAVTAKPDLAAPVEQASKSTLVQQVAQARAEVATWPDSVRESAGIPPQQAPDPIYLIRPKAGGTTWTECISEQSYDAAMRLGVYESRVVVEVGAAGCVRDAEILDWLEMKAINVRQNLRYGSRDMFWATPEDRDGEEDGPSNLRAQCLAAIAKEKAQ